jgi:hypothetical protein
LRPRKRGVDQKTFSVRYSDTAQIPLTKLVDHLWQIWIGASSSERADIRGTSFARDDAATAMPLREGTP